MSCFVKRQQVFSFSKSFYFQKVALFKLFVYHIVSIISRVLRLLFISYYFIFCLWAQSPNQVAQEVAQNGPRPNGFPSPTKAHLRPIIIFFKAQQFTPWPPVQAQQERTAHANSTPNVLFPSSCRLDSSCCFRTRATSAQLAFSSFPMQSGMLAQPSMSSHAPTWSSSRC